MRSSRVVALILPPLLACGVARAGHYERRDLTSDDPTVLPAPHTDPNLKNAWGLAASPTGPWWVADNGTGLSTLYDDDGAPQLLVVSVPGANGPASPTGLVFNDTGKFWVSDDQGHVGSALFIFASEDGTISGWSPAVPPPAPSTQAQLAVDNSADDAVYKGLALARTHHGEPRLYATDFHNNKIDVFDENFDAVCTHGRFVDDDLPDGYAPFGIHNIGGRLFVTYALQDADAHDDVKGPGHGFVDEFDAEGVLLRRVASGGALDSPWGVARAPDRFGRFSDDLLIGNFGDGVINAYEFRARGPLRHEGALRDERGAVIAVDGLWSIEFGNGGAAGPRHTLFFTAGPFGEADGLFGSIRAEHGRDR
ncbi:MAG TPA: TIGR03118 family protein [Polyangia bacterium]|nr:TIGR03118 family protein [Polyangia bacterium]